MAGKGKGKPEEAEFEAIIAGFGKSAVLFRNRDAADIKGRSTTGAQVHVPPTPSDYVLFMAGYAGLAEVKATGKTAFNFDMITRDQLGACERTCRAKPGGYLFFVKNTNTNRWYAVPGEAVLNAGKKSLTWAELEPYAWRNN